MDIFSRPEQTKENLSDQDKKIDFAGKSGEDLNKKDSRPVFDEKKLEDIYDVKEEKKEASNEKASVPEPEIIEEPAPIKQNSLAELWEKIKKKLIKSGKTKNKVLEVNLVKEEIVKYFDWQKGVLFFLVALFFSFFLLSAGYWGISWWAEKKQVSDNSSYTQNYFKVSKEIKELEPQIEDVLMFKQRLDLSNSLLKSHIYWTNFFDFLENNTLSDVYFSSFSGDISGKYQFNATSNNVDAVNVQIKKLLENPYVKNAQVDSTAISFDQDGMSKISFQLIFLLDPQIFLKGE